METPKSQLVVEVSGVESPKFTSPLLLVHGLWCGADVWRRYAGFLAHRGWSCHALNLRGRCGRPPARGLEDYETDVREAMASLDAQPVVVGHDIGGLLALRAAASARAVVALAPCVPAFDPAGLVRGLARLGLRAGRPVRAPRGEPGRRYVGDPALTLVPEPSAVVRTLMRDTIEVPSSATPTLIVAGGQDLFVPFARAEALARRLGAAFSVDTSAGHALPVEAGWERRVNDLHRWLIQQLGDPLLALREESEQDE